MTTSESVLSALQSALLVRLPGAVADRNTILPLEIPPGGVVILRDGNPGDPEVTMSPLAWHFEHRAEIDVLTIGANRNATFDALKAGISLATSADRTLGGLCDWVEAEAPQLVAMAADGGDEIKAATIAVILHFSTSDPLA